MVENRRVTKLRRRKLKRRERSPHLIWWLPQEHIIYQL